MNEQELSSNQPSPIFKILDKAKWRSLISEWEKSKESQKQFCNRLELNINTFTYMRAQFLKKDKKDKSLKFIPVSISAENIPIDTSELILESINGIKLRIQTSIDSAKFKQLLTLIGW